MSKDKIVPLDKKYNFEVCGNSNMRNLTEEDRENGRSHKCSKQDPCKSCLNKIKISQDIKTAVQNFKEETNPENILEKHNESIEDYCYDRSEIARYVKDFPEFLDKIIEKIADYGYGDLEFHTADISLLVLGCQELLKQNTKLEKHFGKTLVENQNLKEVEE